MILGQTSFFTSHIFLFLVLRVKDTLIYQTANYSAMSKDQPYSVSPGFCGILRYFFMATL
jgi:hypothetical protein